MAFRTAASLGVKAGLVDAGSIVLEPVSIVTGHGARRAAGPRS
jgi:elongation factor G